MDTTRRTALLAALAASGCATATEEAPAQAALGPYKIPFTEVIPLTSQSTGVDYLLYVRVPAAYAQNDTRYPVIVTLDADYSFAVCANHLEHLADRMNQAPQSILVSIAVANIYPNRTRYYEERSRDYTPIYWPDGGNTNTPYQAHSGGGPNFLHMIETEALALIDARFRTLPGERTLVGHSYGGLFSAWVLLERPDLFDRYLIVSPSLWYANKWMFDREAERTSVRLPRKTRVYIAAGSWEEQPERHGFMVSESVAFAGLLAARGDPNLLVKSRVFEDETHASIFPAAFSTGIRHMHQTML
jgi:predicted alpha/beta superfamily hydrolase